MTMTAKQKKAKPVYRPDQLQFAEKVATAGAAKRAAKRTEPQADDLFQTKHTAKAIADRAEKTSAATRSMAERHRDAAKEIDLKPLPLPIDADEYYRHASAWISGAMDEAIARKRWKDEAALRASLEVTQKQARLLSAGLDGRCNRLKSGLPS